MTFFHRIKFENFLFLETISIYSNHYFVTSDTATTCVYFFSAASNSKIVKNWFALSSCDLRRRHHTSLSTFAPPLREIRHTEQNSRREIQISRRDS
jgi:hypothetical protein